MIEFINRYYIANKGNFIVRKENNEIIGTDIVLVKDDSINNYIEQPYTKESFLTFYKDKGLSETLAKIRWNITHPNDKYDIVLDNPILSKLSEIKAKKQNTNKNN